MKGDKIIIQALVSADIQKVWDYYTRPEHILNWNFASDDWQCPHASNDMQVGGKYIARMEAKDGSFGFDFEAVYDQIAVGKGFTYTMPDGREVAVTFNDVDGETEVCISFDGETENPVEMQRAGWLSILNNFKNYTEKN